MEDIFANVCFGAEDVAWLAAFDYYLQSGKIPPDERMSAIIEAAREVELWWPIKGGVVVMVDRPLVRKADPETGLFHCEAGPALAYRDGTKIYCLDNERYSYEQWTAKLRFRALCKSNREALAARAAGKAGS